ncbi:winged helix-turn-helix domain-containing protein [Streptomyces virginiae]|uniref:helix-turn-helix transcriptional regulator n=1 Tax=Streptomyces virginiae TaxID=1961 RepID=UPI0006907174|nr:helix-turn-helix domain-containing protein [Streptomyces virginiae]WSC75165.1 winged helix-turn-helix domain-containing protein [Streptomyces virginiae]
MESEHRGPRRNGWTFLTNHARVLIAIARDPGIRLRDIAVECGLTERTVQAIVTDLEADGYLSRTRDGRRNRYVVASGARFRHPAEADHEIAGLLAYLTGPLTTPTSPSAPAAEVANDTPGQV